MKAFWLDGGLHIEPESPDEGRSLRVLWRTMRRCSIGAPGAGDGPKDPIPSSSCGGKQSSKRIVTNKQLVP